MKNYLESSVFCVATLNNLWFEKAKSCKGVG